MLSDPETLDLLLAGAAGALVSGTALYLIFSARMQRREALLTYALESEYDRAREYRAEADAYDTHIAETRLEADKARESVEYYRESLSDVLNVFEEGTALLARDGSLVAWNGCFAEFLRPGGGDLESGLSFDNLIPVVLPREKWSERSSDAFVSGPGFLEKVDGRWTSCFWQTTAGEWCTLRARRIHPGWILSIRRRNNVFGLGVEQLRDLLRIARHDLRAPIRALKTIPVWMRERLDEVPDEALRAEYDDLLGEAIVQAHRLDGLVIGLTELTEAKTAVAECVLVSPREAVSRILGANPLPDSMVVELGALPDTVVADPKKLDRVLEAVIDNAVKHHDRAHGRIVIRGGAERDQCHIDIVDDGPSVPEEARERVFDPFRTLKPRDEVEGSGLGLTIASALVQTWEGTIEILDADPADGTAGEGRGTCVRISFPNSMHGADAAAA